MEAMLEGRDAEEAGKSQAEIEAAQDAKAVCCTRFFGREGFWGAGYALVLRIHGFKFWC